VTRAPLTREEYDQIRAAVDARRRAQLRAARSRGCCSTCGCDADEYTAGCLTCFERHRYRERRLNNELRLADNLRRRNQRRRKRAGTAA